MGFIGDLLIYASLFVTISSAICAVTPTPKDDVWIAKLYRFIDIMAINIGKAKQ